MGPDWSRIVAHADMDAFYAAVEQLADPKLRGRPILVGSPGGRGVVLTASYEARPYGVGSAMPMAEAQRRCPDALVVPPNFERYQAASKAIMGVFRDFSPDVEPLSLDEAFLDMSGATHIFGSPKDMGRQIQEAVFEATRGLTVSVGLSGTKYVAKVAGAIRKPNGLTAVPQNEAKAFLAKLPVSRLWGAGPKTVARLERLGFLRIGDLARADPNDLTRQLGSMGQHFYRLAHAQDPRRVQRSRRMKSIGSERTLATDVVTLSTIKLHLRRSAENVGERLRKKRLLACGVRIKLKTKRFQLRSRQTKLVKPTDVSCELYEAGVRLLDELEHREAYRLVGMAAFDLATANAPMQLDLFNHGARRRLETTIDGLTARFGPGILCRAADLEDGRDHGISPNLDFLEGASP